MAKITLPYGRSEINHSISDERLNAILIPGMHQYQVKEPEEKIVRDALQNPIGTPRLRDLAKNRNKITIISSDHTRPVPSQLTMPLLLEEIREGNPDAEITILIATGFHRAPTREELQAKYGEKIVNEEKIIIHDSCDDKNMVKVGVLPSGGELKINRLALESDLLIAEGFIEPHFFAGFSGGRKSVLPGIVSKNTVMANHCAEFIAHEKARTGILEGNPIHQDMIYAAEKVNLAFILNVVINSKKQVISAFAGHREKAHLKGCDFVARMAGVKKSPAEIVITTNGGYPLDQNIYQTVKGMTAAEATCSKGGVIIVVSECSDGHGGDSFFKTFAEAASVEEVMSDIIARERDQTVPDQWESQILARVLLKHQVIMVTDAPQEMVETMHMHWAADLKEAIRLADIIIGNEDSGITVIPDGVSVIIH